MDHHRSLGRADVRLLPRHRPSYHDAVVPQPAIEEQQVLLYQERQLRALTAAGGSLTEDGLWARHRGHSAEE